MEKAIKQHSYVRPLLILILFSAIIRGLVAAFTELGNDEVYYWTYALFPDLSHFDHPPMVGFLIQLTTFNLQFVDEFFIRLGGIILGSLNTWIIYLLGKQLFNQRAGWISALLYTASIYAGIISNTFILPDTPQLFFWLLSLYLASLSFVRTQEISANSRNLLFLMGVSIGAAILSKYTSVFLWSGSIAYLMFHNRKWYKIKELYFALFVSALMITPILFWNMEHDFISFSFHSDRVGIFHSGFRFDYFFTELLGQFFYNNPFVFVLVWFGIFAAFRKGFKHIPEGGRFLIYTGLPLIVLFLFFALFRRTLPHWTGPAYVTLIPLAAWRIDAIMQVKSRQHLIPPIVNAALMLFLVIILAGFLQINSGFFWQDNKGKISSFGKMDPSLDMYGWDQLCHSFKQARERDIAYGIMSPEAAIITNKWFPAAHLDFYVATPLGMKLKTLGSLIDTHKYHWITEERGGLTDGEDFYYISSSHAFKDPLTLYKANFDEILPADTLPIIRNQEIVEYFFVYHLKGYKLPKDSSLQ